MEKLTVTKPFFVLNPKSYLYGTALLELALVADQLAEENGVTIFVTAPYADLKSIADNTSHIIVTAQHISGIKPGRGMGHVLPEAVYNAGARATFLNHAEQPLTTTELIKSLERAQELGIITIVCADSLKEAQTLARLKPDILLCEPTELIGTGQTSDDTYIQKTNEGIHEIDPQILVMQAAGISTAQDVFHTISLGADGTGCTSGIVCAEDPQQMLKEMIAAVIKGKEMTNEN